ncbi:endonuclease domain-containing 1 protein-like isoform X2 [Kryptolebias marmoratus]|uniref:endonuclease domain-containing 1 protein-like isoform X2 n=1 Tax=Kryptolebias marmoratus TaxID=37003 RepID=UPI000D5311ED|nr:endonuclease domain-containing 1 protein-like isoform X2 [Kryptolebias marmoratus]
MFTQTDQTLVCFLIIVMAGAEVLETISPECKQFFYMGTPPRGLEEQPLKKICQFYSSKPRFVTLYDTISHIPVYSAYTFKRSDGSKKVDVPWMYEPQLSTVSGSREMESFPSLRVHKSFEDSQAVLDDYSDTVMFERGQLNPDEHQAHPDDKAATYTLTNVVPRVREFNIGPWKAHEHTIRKRLNNYCRGTAFVVTGVTTSGQMIRRLNINRLAIPTYLWSAYCCTDFDHNAPYSERSKFPAFAAHGLNDRENNRVQEMTVQQLEDFLKRVTYVSSSFQIFYDNCAPPNSADSPLHLA